MLLIELLAVYSIEVVALVSVIILGLATDVREQAIIKEMLGALVLWVVVGGPLNLKFRDRMRTLILRIPMGWRVKFVLFCILLALVEEAITTSMTNLAPLYDATPEESHITASANYVYVVLFHSVIVFIPMFIGWSYLLGRYDLSPNAVFLMYGLTGSTAEAFLNPTGLISGFSTTNRLDRREIIRYAITVSQQQLAKWSDTQVVVFWCFVYGLMIYLPAYSLPKDRGARKPRWIHHLYGVIVPMACAIPVAPVVVLVRTCSGFPCSRERRDSSRLRAGTWPSRREKRLAREPPLVSAGEPGIVRGGIHVRRSLNRVAGQGPIANACYSHLGGRLGKALMEHILKQGWLEPVEGKRFRLTDKGRKGLRDWGIDPGAIEAEGPKG